MLKLCARLLHQRELRQSGVEQGGLLGNFETAGESDPVSPAKQFQPTRHKDNDSQEIIMEEQTNPVPETETDRELTEQEIAEVAGGFNPQPDPPRRY